MVQCLTGNEFCYSRSDCRCCSLTQTDTPTSAYKVTQRTPPCSICLLAFERGKVRREGRCWEEQGAGVPHLTWQFLDKLPHWSGDVAAFLGLVPHDLFPVLVVDYTQSNVPATTQATGRYRITSSREFELHRRRDCSSGSDINKSLRSIA